MNGARALLAAAVLGLLAACSPPDAAKPDASSQPSASGDVQPAPQPADQRPPTVGGLYIARDVCPGEGCYLEGRIHAYKAANLYDKAGAGAVITGTVTAGEWVEILAREEHVFPLRGVVREGRKHFATGDVIYLLSSEGEGCYATWSKGAIGSWCDPEAVGSPETDEVIAFDAPPGAELEGEGLWIKVKTAKNSEGWLHGADDFACTGYQDRDADCPPLPQ